MFHPQSFNSVSFSSISFNGASKPVQEGRSGYWRLFFTQLQEQSEQPKKHVEKLAEKPLDKGSIKVVKRVKKITSEVTPPEKFEVFPFVPRWVNLPDRPQVPLAKVWGITRELRDRYLEYHVNVVKYVQASNDEEDVELLLFVA